MLTFTQFLLTESPDQPLHNTTLSPEQHADFLAHRKTFKPHHVKALHKYKETSDEINGKLRNPKTKNKAQFKALDHITSQRIKHPISTYRGAYDRYEHLKPGDTHKEEGYTGTSLDHMTAYHYAKKGFRKNEKGETRSHGTIAKIHAPAGTKGHYLDLDHDTSTATPRDDEFLLHRGTTCKVSHISHHDHNGTKIKVVHMHVQHQD